MTKDSSLTSLGMTGLSVKIYTIHKSCFYTSLQNFMEIVSGHPLYRGLNARGVVKSPG